MIENIDTIKSKIFILTGISDNEVNNLKIEIFVDDILSFCQRSDIPLEMENIVVDIIAKKLQSTEGDKIIQSYSEGDMSVSYKVDDEIDKFGGRLNSFKMIVGA